MESEVVIIEQSVQNSNKLAVGYLDGSLRVFDLQQRPDDEMCLPAQLTFNGHKSAITTINFDDDDGSRLVSGSKDTDLVLWDLVSECGLFRLRGHKAPITKAIFIPNRNILISAGKDMLIKFWDLDTRHCFKTLANHRSEISDLILVNNDERLITGCNDNELRVFQLKYRDQTDIETGRKNEINLKKLNLNKEDEEMKSDNDDDDEEGDDSTSILECTLIGSLIRESKNPLSQLRADTSQSMFCSHSANEKHCEIYKINSEEEIRKRLAKRFKKQKRKLNETSEEMKTDADVAIEKTVQDEFTRVSVLKTKHKIKSLDLICETITNSNISNIKQRKMHHNHQTTEDDDQILMKCRVACLLVNNKIEVYSIDIKKQINDIEPPSLIYSIVSPGHRTDVRTLSFSSDSTAIASASGDCLKVWNRMSLSCIRTFECDYAISSLFLSDDNHIIIGTKVPKQSFVFFNIES
jgi:U3 small nucleolar RNA-associated protein 12